MKIKMKIWKYVWILIKGNVKMEIMWFLLVCREVRVIVSVIVIDVIVIVIIIIIYFVMYLCSLFTSFIFIFISLSILVDSQTTICSFTCLYFNNIKIFIINLF